MVVTVNVRTYWHVGEFVAQAEKEQKATHRKMYLTESNSGTDVEYGHVKTTITMTYRCGGCNVNFQVCGDASLKQVDLYTFDTVLYI